MKRLEPLIPIIAIALIFSGILSKIKNNNNQEKIEINNEEVVDDNPSNANGNDLNNLLIVKEEYTLSFNCPQGIANWVGWTTNQDDLGNLSRSDDFQEDNTLPKGCYKVDEDDYRGSGYHRGHLLPSGDRTKDSQANSATFLMTNMIPQHPSNNQGVWRKLEEHSRDLVREGLTLHIFAGGIGQIEKISNNRISVPEHVWKVVLIENERSGEVDAIAVIMPNSEKVRKTDWTDYITTVNKVESLTNYDFFSYLIDDIEDEIESKIYQ